MMNLESRWIVRGITAATVMLGLTLAGCSGEEPAPVVQTVAPPPRPAAPPAPTVTPIEQLMAELNIDQRVVLPEELAPPTDPERRAVLEFFDAFARGNSAGVKGMITLADQLELDALVESGAWQDAASKVRRIDVQTGANSTGQSCALAVIEVSSPVGLSFQPQLWYYQVEQDQPTFEAAPSPPGIMDRLTGDWIATWHQILADELAEANKPDVEITIAQKTQDDEDGTQQGPGRGGLRNPTGPAPVLPGSLPGDPSGR